MRNTKQKELILDIINNSYNHYTAKEVYEVSRKTITNISLGTVYRILNDLVDSHKIKRIKTKFGIDHYDRFNDKHCHFICNKCGKIVDIYNYKLDEKKIDSLKNYDIYDYDITFLGLCNDCKERKG